MVLLLCIAATAIAQPHFGRGGGGEFRGGEFRGGEGPSPEQRAKMQEMIKERLGLSDEQMGKLKTLREKRTGNRELGEELWRERAALGELIRDVNADPESIRAKAKSVNEKTTALNEARIEGLIELKSILTADQQEKVVQFMEKRRGMMHPGMQGPGGGDGKGPHGFGGPGAGGPRFGGGKEHGPGPGGFLGGQGGGTGGRPHRPGPGGGFGGGPDAMDGGLEGLGDFQGLLGF